MQQTIRSKGLNGTFPTAVAIYGPDSGGRAAAEQFVHQCFAQAYAADIRQFMPHLMSLRDQSGAIQGVLGLRTADEHRLFLERYLDVPVEQALAAHIRRPIDPSRIVEVGNLAVGTPGGGRWLITALTAYLSAAEEKWAVFTIGPVLRNAFTKLGISLVDLGPADAGRLSPAELSLWGRYYAQKPRAMAGCVSQGYQALRQQCHAQEDLGKLWRSAAEAGKLAA